MTKAAFCVLLALVLQAQAPPGPVADLTAVSIVTGANATGLYHRDGCAWLKNVPTLRFTVTDAETRHFQPHCLCVAGKDGLPPCEAAGTATPAGAAASALTTPPATPLRAVESVPPAPPGPAVSAGQCQAITKKGVQCSRRAQAGRAFCWQH
jgi:hypothetical protein